VLLDEEPCDRLRPLHCLPVAFSGLHDRSLHEQMPGEGERLGVAEAGLFGQCAHERPDVREVSGAGVADRVFAIAGLEEDLDEGAALVVLLLEPVVEDVENREQALLGAGAALPGAGFNELPRPASSRSSRNASTRSSLEGKWRWSVALATAARLITSSTPTARMPRRENNS
jgi:hypothetical protein